MEQAFKKSRSSFSMLMAYYNLLVGMILSLGSPFWLFQMAFHRRFRAGLGERFTRYRGLDKGGPPAASIWIQAASVGEVSAVIPLVRLIREQLPRYRLVLTCQTDAGRRFARQKIGDEALVLLAPVDLTFLVRRFIRFFSPRILLLVETELWPSMINEVHRQGIPIVMISGRISARAFGYYRQAGFFFRPFLRMIDLFNMRGERDARRILSLGAPRDRVFVRGNIKFDSLPSPGPPPESLERFRRESGWSETDPVIVGGSTFRGEEVILLDAYDRLKDDYPSLKLILAPRHIERIGEVRDLVRARGRSYRLLTGLPSGPGADIAIVDRIGLLSELYLLGTVVFVGRSLTGKGGQNPIEPAALGKPIIFGPFMDNFREIADELAQARGAVVVRDASSLETALRALLSSGEEADRMGKKAREAVEKHRGASQRNLDEIKRLLERS